MQLVKDEIDLLRSYANEVLVIRKKAKLQEDFWYRDRQIDTLLWDPYKEISKKSGPSRVG